MVESNGVDLSGVWKDDATEGHWSLISPTRGEGEGGGARDKAPSPLKQL